MLAVILLDTRHDELGDVTTVRGCWSFEDDERELATRFAAYVSEEIGAGAMVVPMASPAAELLNWREEVSRGLTALERAASPPRPQNFREDVDGLIDPDCRAGKHESCVGGSCGCARHTDPARPCWGSDPNVHILPAQAAPTEVIDLSEHEV